jgi:hypothetical protein
MICKGIIELAEKLVIPGGFPESAETDAIHIAAATVYRIDYLATWNIRHIANAQIRRITEGILENNGYRIRHRRPRVAGGNTIHLRRDQPLPRIPRSV